MREELAEVAREHGEGAVLDRGRVDFLPAGNVSSASDAFGIPPGRVVELGAQVAL